MSEQYLTHINEAMNALISANNMPGMKGTDNNTNSVYIVNYMQNNAFANGITTDYKMRHMITRDPDDKKLKMKSVDDQDEYGFDNSTDIKGAYRVLDKANLSEGLTKIYNNIGKEVDEGFIYECILGDKMYSWDQIEFSDKVEKVAPFKDLINGMNESIRHYTLYGKEKAGLISEIKYGNKDMNTLLSEYSNVLLNESVLLEDSINNIYYNVIEIGDPRLAQYVDKATLDSYNGHEIKKKVKDPYTGKEIYKKEIVGKFKGEYLIDLKSDEIIGHIAIYGIHINHPVINKKYANKEFYLKLLRDAIGKFGGRLITVTLKNSSSDLEIFKNLGFKISTTKKANKEGYTTYKLEIK